MTIVEAIKTVLEDAPDGLTAKETYQAIIRAGLYKFGAKDPVGVVNSQIRRRCVGLDFPTAYPVKTFRISGRQGKKNRFALYNGRDGSALDSETQAGEKDDLLPEEKIGAAVLEHVASIRQQVLDAILDSSPYFFKHLVVALLLKMGYGSGNQAGIVTKASRDGGIEGVISEDKLGLDLIYLQAKRYRPKNKVGAEDLQQFVDAMEHMQKGVFITTSGFTEEAVSYIEKQQQKRVKLIDGRFLSELLVKYEVGVYVAQKVSIYKLDSEYFNVGS